MQFVTITVPNNLFYQRTAWRKLRRKILAAHGLASEGTVLHHKLPLADYPHLGLDPSNLVPMPHGEHSVLHNRQRPRPMCDANGNHLDPTHPWFAGGRAEKSRGLSCS